MFTGLVEGRGRVAALEPRGAGRVLRVLPLFPGFEARAGQSIAVSGVCLSALAAAGEGEALAFDLSAETLARTRLAELAPGAEVNLERALRLGDRLDGHLVSGHVDGLGTLVERVEEEGGGARLVFEVPTGFERWLVEKGSVTIDGVSLTVVRPEGRRFAVAAIPLTLAHTTLGRARAGERVHLEADAIGKWVERLLAPRHVL